VCPVASRQRRYLGSMGVEKFVRVWRAGMGEKVIAHESFTIKL